MRRLAVLVALLFTVMVVAPTAHPAAAQDASTLTVTLVPNVTKAKIGDIVEFTVLLENTGTQTISDVSVAVWVPDALDYRATDCPNASGASFGGCLIGDVSPGFYGEALKVYVHVGSRSANGPVTAVVYAAGGLSVTAEIPAIKVIGSPKIR